MTSEIPVVRKPWERHRVQLTCPDPGKTVQSERDSTDINSIVARYQRTGHMPPGRVPGQYGDVSAFNDYYGNLLEKAQGDIAEAEAWFAREAERKAEAEKQAATETASAVSESVQPDSTTDQTKA